jgi:hypothetical protein
MFKFCESVSDINQKIKIKMLVSAPISSMLLPVKQFIFSCDLFVIPVHLPMPTYETGNTIQAIA